MKIYAVPGIDRCEGRLLCRDDSIWKANQDKTLVRILNRDRKASANLFGQFL